MRQVPTDAVLVEQQVRSVMAPITPTFAYKDNASTNMAYDATPLFTTLCCVQAIPLSFCSEPLTLTSSRLWTCLFHFTETHFFCDKAETHQTMASTSFQSKTLAEPDATMPHSRQRLESNRVETTTTKRSYNKLTCKKTSEFVDG